MSVSVVIPAFNEAEVIGTVIGDIRAVLGAEAEIIVVDDGSTDGTADMARSAGARVVRHPDNIGNGAAVKAGIRASRGERVVLMDGDGQHAASEIPRLLGQLEQYDMVVAARVAGSNGRLHRNVANRIYNGLASYVSGRPIPDLTSGFRAVRGPVLRRFVYLLPNTFSYPSTLTLALLRSGHRVTFLPIAARRRVGRSKIRLIEDGARFFLIILKIATLFSPLRVFLPVSALFLFAGLGNYAYTFARFGRFTNMSALMIANSVLVFLLSLVAEQIAQMRMERTEPVERERDA
ncbi:MAG TPA: glycosyltransferase family 2 protein [Candidatus Polarisedimenticolaceae bacterium]|nr:glycosyltransferase family 2 protein [Candidatus Polarisedimenticolaceae bacterium]